MGLSMGSGALSALVLAGILWVRVLGLSGEVCSISVGLVSRQVAFAVRVSGLQV